MLCAWFHKVLSHGGNCMCQFCFCSDKLWEQCHQMQRKKHNATFHMFAPSINLVCAIHLNTPRMKMPVCCVVSQLMKNSGNSLFWTDMRIQFMACWFFNCLFSERSTGDRCVTKQLRWLRISIYTWSKKKSPFCASAGTMPCGIKQPHHALTTSHLCPLLCVTLITWSRVVVFFCSSPKLGTK